jgi:hypothetical protein
MSPVHCPNCGSTHIVPRFPSLRLYGLLFPLALAVALVALTLTKFQPGYFIAGVVFFILVVWGYVRSYQLVVCAQCGYQWDTRRQPKG